MRCNRLVRCRRANRGVDHICDTRANSIITGKKSAAYALVAVRLGGKWICRYVLAAARDVSLHDNIRAFAEIINAPIHL